MVRKRISDMECIAVWPRMYRFFPVTANVLFSLAFIIYCRGGLRFVLALLSMSGIQNLPYKPYTDNAAGEVNIIPFQGKEFARADAGTHINAE